MRSDGACAGRDGRFALEDAAFAGWLCAGLARRGATFAGAAARLSSTLAPSGGDEVRSVVQGSTSGRLLRRIGPEYARDVEYCAGLDRLPAAFEV